MRKGETAGHPVFPEQRLAFMNRHGRGLSKGPGKPLMALIRQALLVKGVAPFMGRCKKTGEGLTWNNPCRDAVIRRAKGDGKRVWRPRHAGDGGILPP